MVDNAMMEFQSRVNCPKNAPSPIVSGCDDLVELAEIEIHKLNTNKKARQDIGGRFVYLRS